MNDKKDKNENKDKNKDKKENDMPPPNFNFIEPIKKRSKLVLPEPQISDVELEQVVKIGKMNSNVLAELDDDQNASRALLSDYSITSNNALNELRTPKQSNYSRESIMAEAQNLMALTNTETPLKGGENTPLVEVQGFTSGELATPGYKTSTVSATPNLVLSTPFRTPSSKSGETPIAGNFTPASVRDQLNINPEESLALQLSNQKSLIKENRDRLRQVLADLPAPKNEYEIVVNEDDDETTNDQNEMELDQSDLDNNLHKSIQDDLDNIKRKQTLAVQRQLPRPQEIVNNLILQIPTLQPGQELNELQKSDQLIKEEMLKLLQFDEFKNPTDRQLMIRNIKKTESKPVRLDKIDEQSLKKANQLLNEEMQNLESTSGKELNLDEYNEIWEDCWSQLIYSESDDKFTHINRLDKKSKIESLNYMFKKNKEHMNREAKKASKLEKKLKVLLGGYQARAQISINQLIKESNDLEQSIIELDTFKMLKEMEDKAITKRVGSVMADVKRQITREKVLQQKYDDLKREKEELNDE